MQIRLAKIRTLLANYRTLLAHMRTAFAFVIGGLVLIHYFQDFHYLYLYVGIAFLIIGLAFAAHGTFSFFRTKKEINQIDEPPLTV